MTLPSEPPPSSPPLSADASAPPGRLSWPQPQHPPGWRPAEDDLSLAAVDWRARTGLRRADRALGALDKLNDNVAKLNATLDEWSSKAERHWKTVSRLAWGVGLPLLVTSVLGLAAWVWKWVSTLHH